MALTIAARAPNHLGDGVVAMPALSALSRLGELTIAGPPWCRDLYRDIPARVVPRGILPPVDVAVLFSPSLRAALEALPARVRIGTPTDGRSRLLTEIVPVGLHTWDTYRALVAPLGARIEGPPRWEVRPSDPLPELPEGHIGLNPISASGMVRQWPRFGALAERISEPVVVYGGPGEQELVRAQSGGRACCVGLSLPAFGRALSRCKLFVSNDSGAAHFARAAGAEVLVLYGSTVPWRTGPLGASALLGEPPPCAPCYARSCRREGQRRYACLEIEIDDVLAAIAARR